MAMEAAALEVATPIVSLSSFTATDEILENLASYGFCSVDPNLSPEDLDRSISLAQTLASECQALPKETSADYLGLGVRGDALWLEDSSNGESHSERSPDDLLQALGLSLAEASEDALGLDTFARSRTLLRRHDPNINSEELPLTSADVKDGVVEELIHFVRARHLCLLHFLDAQDVTVSFTPASDSDFDSARVPVSPGRLLVFRHDALQYSLETDKSALVLQAWLVSEPLSVDFEELLGSQERRMEAMNLSGPPLPLPNGPPCYVASIVERMAGSVYTSEDARAMFMSGGDTAVRWPTERWREEDYYMDDPNAAQYGKTYSVHGAFMDFSEVKCFDNNFFGISDEEATCMMPEQRLVLETGFRTLIRAGFVQEKLRGSNIGVFVGDVGSEELLPPPFNTYTNEGLQGGLTASRLSYVLDLKGPSSSHDTACSSTLMALGFAHWKMKACVDRPLPAAIVSGVNLHMTPFRYIALGSGGMLTKKGRCFTFDASADGYLRGEGCGALALRVATAETDKEERYAECIGSALNQDGRSASLTAPNGPSQTAAIKSSMRMANIGPEMVGAAECHGTGTALGDPIEIGAMMAALGNRPTGTRPLAFTTSKINLGHTEAHAGMAGIAKCVMVCSQGTVAPHAHLRGLSPHLSLEGFPCFVGTEPTDLFATSNVVGVSSFGFGGSNGRADFWGRSTNGMRQLEESSDYIEVGCPVCSGPMCWLCGMSIPTDAPPVKHHCSLVRSPGASYEHCGHCYGGPFLHGEVLQLVPPLPGKKLFALGTWDGWKVPCALSRVDSENYVFTITLGDSRWERFYLLVDEDRKQALYPAGNSSDASARVLGPDDQRGARTWVIDGRKDGFGQGTSFNVTVRWTDAVQVSWESIPQLTEGQTALAAAGASLTEIAASGSDGLDDHKYSLRGSWTGYRLQAMKVRYDKKLYEATFKIGSNRFEEFNIVRDQDLTQIIHPRHARSPIAGSHIEEPDDNLSKTWLVQGAPNESVRVRFVVKNGEFLVEVSSATGGLRRCRGGLAEVGR
mmetsp:Transcript_1236/g.2717  ORF Transcript_1236/g.2717 Transcript_1236/m.2717 type:complete len:1026 (+) Transcript_1236:86-3163(+)